MTQTLIYRFKHVIKKCYRLDLLKVCQNLMDWRLGPHGSCVQWGSLWQVNDWEGLWHCEWIIIMFTDSSLWWLALSPRQKLELPKEWLLLVRPLRDFLDHDNRGEMICQRWAVEPLFSLASTLDYRKRAKEISKSHLSLLPNYGRGMVSGLRLLLLLSLLYPWAWRWDKSFLPWVSLIRIL